MNEGAEGLEDSLARNGGYWDPLVVTLDNGIWFIKIPFQPFSSYLAYLNAHSLFPFILSCALVDHCSTAGGTQVIYICPNVYLFTLVTNAGS